MAKRVSASGRCRLCGKTFGGSGMSRHMEACLKAGRAIPAGEAAVKERGIFHLRVHAGPDYWMHLAAPVSRRLYDLDSFLRGIWLECCGHLSSFTIAGESYDAYPAGAWGAPDGGLNVRLDNALKDVKSFGHEYDFGTTTACQIQVVGRHKLVAPDAIVVLARNAAHQYPCGKCGQPAVRVDMQRMYDGEGFGLCRKHGENREMTLPITNSPRMGECGYGGEDDTDEDAFKPSKA